MMKKPWKNQGENRIRNFIKIVKKSIIWSKVDWVGFWGRIGGFFPHFYRFIAFCGDEPQTRAVELHVENSVLTCERARLLDGSLVLERVSRFPVVET